MDASIDVDVEVSVGVIDKVVVGVGGVIRMVIAGVVDGTNGGVGEKIAGRREGETSGVATAKGISIPLHDTSRSTSKAVSIILAIFPLSLVIVSEILMKNMGIFNVIARE